MTSTSKLSVYFEDPFWVAVAEIEDEDSYCVARYVFGAEPTDPEIALFLAQRWKHLRFSLAVKLERTEQERANPKRMRRIAKKEMAKIPGRGTKAQQALAEQHKAAKTSRKQKARDERLADKEAMFRRKQDKRKQKHRGH